MNRQLALAAAGALCLLALPSCQTYDVSLTYDPPERGEQVQRGASVVEVGRVTDKRDVQGTEIGAIRNEVGIPIKVLHAKKPVAQITHNAFAYALDVRGMLNRRNARYTISAEVLELWCHQYASMDAACRIRVTVNRKGRSTPVFSKTYYAKRSRPTPAVTYWSRPEDVAVVISEALQAVIDGALDDSEFRRALR